MVSTFLMAQGLIASSRRLFLTALVKGEHYITFIKLLYTWHNVLLTVEEFSLFQEETKFNPEKDDILEFRLLEQY